MCASAAAVPAAHPPPPGLAGAPAAPAACPASCIPVFGTSEAPRVPPQEACFCAKCRAAREAPEQEPSDTAPPTQAPPAKGLAPSRADINPNLIRKHPFNRSSKPLHARTLPLVNSIISCYYTMSGCADYSRKCFGRSTRLEPPSKDLNRLHKARSFSKSVLSSRCPSSSSPLHLNSCKTRSKYLSTTGESVPCVPNPILNNLCLAPSLGSKSLTGPVLSFGVGLQRPWTHSRS